ncbi:arsenical pump-driving ATPase [Rozella allomycis CSF55]|nr:arsenical pump-driving ATPase [Rozella allomycis CSF55]
MEPSLENVLEQKSLKWIFVGGKGGVGKTTTSCSLAVQLARVRDKVLLLSTDPAHNLSDAFDQKFGKDPTLVNGFTNLYAMEIDPTARVEEFVQEQGSDGPMGSIMKELSVNIPGIDEAMNFSLVMKLVKSMDYSVIVFDTAPTGHTLRFLSFPDALDKGLKKLLGFAPLMSQMSGMFGASLNQQDIFSRMKEMRDTVVEVNNQFKDPEKTTFICVCIAEFLSLYENERMIQELFSFDIDVHNVVVNQLLFPKDDSCAHCSARRAMQQKYLTQIDKLYEDFHVVKMPLLTKEVRGVEEIKNFSKMLIEPYRPNSQ